MSSVGACVCVGGGGSAQGPPSPRPLLRWVARSCRNSHACDNAPGQRWSLDLDLDLCVSRAWRGPSSPAWSWWRPWHRKAQSPSSSWRVGRRPSCRRMQRVPGRQAMRQTEGTQARELSPGTRRDTGSARGAQRLVDADDTSKQASPMAAATHCCVFRPAGRPTTSTLGWFRPCCRLGGCL